MLQFSPDVGINLTDGKIIKVTKTLVLNKAVIVLLKSLLKIE